MVRTSRTTNEENSSGSTRRRSLTALLPPPRMLIALHMAYYQAYRHLLRGRKLEKEKMKRQKETVYRPEYPVTSDLLRVQNLADLSWKETYLIGYAASIKERHTFNHGIVGSRIKERVRTMARSLMLYACKMHQTTVPTTAPGRKPSKC